MVDWFVCYEFVDCVLAFGLDCGFPSCLGELLLRLAGEGLVFGCLSICCCVWFMMGFLRGLLPCSFVLVLICVVWFVFVVVWIYGLLVAWLCGSLGCG